MKNNCFSVFPCCQSPIGSLFFTGLTEKEVYSAEIGFTSGQKRRRQIDAFGVFGIVVMPRWNDDMKTILETNLSEPHLFSPCRGPNPILKQRPATHIFTKLHFSSTTHSWQSAKFKGWTPFLQDSPATPTQRDKRTCSSTSPHTCKTPINAIPIHLIYWCTRARQIILRCHNEHKCCTYDLKLGSYFTNTTGPLALQRPCLRRTGPHQGFYFYETARHHPLTQWNLIIQYVVPVSHSTSIFS